ncbi:hypothetical protein YC2023_112972 [Brassica napus]
MQSAIKILSTQHHGKIKSGLETRIPQCLFPSSSSSRFMVNMRVSLIKLTTRSVHGGQSVSFQISCGSFVTTERTGIKSFLQINDPNTILSRSPVAVIGKQRKLENSPYSAPNANLALMACSLSCYFE